MKFVNAEYITIIISRFLYLRFCISFRGSIFKKFLLCGLSFFKSLKLHSISTYNSLVTFNDYSNHKLYFELMYTINDNNHPIQLNKLKYNY